MGSIIEDHDFHAILLGLLPESYRPILSSISTAARVTQTPLTSNELITIITEEYEHRLLTDRRSLKKGRSSALSARANNSKGRQSNTTAAQSNPDAVCYNCDRKGHYKSDCWRPGGGKEGQGPQQRQRCGGHTQKQTANTATEQEHDEYAFVTSDLAAMAKGLNVCTCRAVRRHHTLRHQLSLLPR